MATDQPHIPLAVVAAEAGVSVPTVSKVLNTRPDVVGEDPGPRHRGARAARLRGPPAVSRSPPA